MILQNYTYVKNIGKIRTFCHFVSKKLTYILSFLDTYVFFVDKKYILPVILGTSHKKV